MLLQGKGGPMLQVILMWLGDMGVGAGGGGMGGRGRGWGGGGRLAWFWFAAWSSAVHQTTNKQKPSPLMVMLSGVVGAGGGATPLVTGLDGVLNMRSVNEKVPLSTVISLKRLSSFQAAVSSSNSLPVGQHTHTHYAVVNNTITAVVVTVGDYYEIHLKLNQSHLNRLLFPAPTACL